MEICFYMSFAFWYEKKEDEYTRFRAQGSVKLFVNCLSCRHLWGFAETRVSVRCYDLTTYEKMVLIVLSVLGFRTLTVAWFFTIFSFWLNFESLFIFTTNLGNYVDGVLWKSLWLIASDCNGLMMMKLASINLSLILIISSVAELMLTANISSLSGSWTSIVNIITQIQ